MLIDTALALRGAAWAKTCVPSCKMKLAAEQRNEMEAHHGLTGFIVGVS